MCVGSVLPSPMLHWKRWAAAQKSFSEAGELTGCWGEDGELGGGRVGWDGVG